MKKFLFFSYFLCKIPIFFLFSGTVNSYFLDPSCYLTPCYCNMVVTFEAHLGHVFVNISSIWGYSHFENN